MGDTLELLDGLGLNAPPWRAAANAAEARSAAEELGYPVLVRPHHVIGGRGIHVARNAAELDVHGPCLVDRFLDNAIELDVDILCDGGNAWVAAILEHVERAGVHSGDSVGMFPPQTVSEGDQGLIVATMERIALALGVRGLVNAQFIVREDGIYLIEVNPRASRTVPFMSKVTGVPMVELAVRIALGATLEELGWAGGLLAPPPFVAVKAPAFSTAKLRGVDPSVGPFMQSTGEVIGIHEDPRVAMAKALRGAALVPPRVVAAMLGVPPLALLSIADRDKHHLPRLAAALVRAGYRLAATAGTAETLRASGYEADVVAKLSEAGDLLSVIRSGVVRLVVNTPTPRSGAIRDAAEIRHATIEEGILCLTAIETAIAAAEALDPDVVDRIAEVRSLDEWVLATGASPLRTAPLAIPVAV